MELNLANLMPAAKLPGTPAVPGNPIARLGGTAAAPGAASAAPDVLNALGAAAKADPAAFAAGLAQLMLQASATTTPTPEPEGELSPTDADADADGQNTGDVTSDAVGGLWLALGLPPTAAPQASAGRGLPQALDASRDADGAVTGLPPGLAARVSGNAPDRGRSAQAGPSLPTMPTLPATAAPAASAALTEAFARHVEGAKSDLAGLGAVDAASATAAKPEAPAASPVALNLAGLERLGHALRAAPAEPIDPRLPQAPQQVAETVVWHLGKGAHEVQIQLNPEDLGPIDVKLRVEGDKVNVRFDMADASVRDVVQSSLPNLATLLSARGLALDQAQVFTQQGRGQAPMPMPQTNGNGSDGAAVEAEPMPRITLRRGLVDDYV